MNRGDTLWTPFSRPDHDRGIQLFAFPFAGGGATAFCKWKPLFSENVTVIPVQLPGREERAGEAAITEADTLLPLLAEALAPTFREPFFFWGHSMGGHIAYSLAAWLAQKGLPCPRHLFLSACPPGSSLAGEKIQAQTKAVQETLTEGVPPELLGTILPLLQKDAALVRDLVARRNGRLDIPATFLAADDDSLAPFDAMSDWEGQVTQAMYERFTGGHFSRA